MTTIIRISSIEQVGSAGVFEATMRVRFTDRVTELSADDFMLIVDGKTIGNVMINSVAPGINESEYLISLSRELHESSSSDSESHGTSHSLDIFAASDSHADAIVNHGIQLSLRPMLIDGKGDLIMDAGHEDLSLLANVNFAPISADILETIGFELSEHQSLLDSLLADSILPATQAFPLDGVSDAMTAVDNASAESTALQNIDQLFDSGEHSI